MDKVVKRMDHKNGATVLEPLPEIPRIYIFIFWSMVLHLIGGLVIDEIVGHGRPDRFTVLNVRLQPRVTEIPASEFPDLFAESLGGLEASLSKLTDTATSNAASNLLPTPNSSVKDPAISEFQGADFYRKSSELDEQPAPLQVVEPHYPTMVGEEGVSGYVKVLLFIDEDGNVRHIEVLESYPGEIFVKAALDAFGAVVFSPGRKNMLPVKSRMIIRVEFNQPA